MGKPLLKHRPTGEVELKVIYDALLGAQSILLANGAAQSQNLVLRNLRVALSLFEGGPPTVEELAPYLGYHWAIRAKTPLNLVRYGNCITKRDYQRATIAAITARGNPGPQEVFLEELDARSPVDLRPRIGA